MKHIEDSKIIGNPISSVIGINISYTENYGKKLIIDSPIIYYDIEGKEFHFFIGKIMKIKMFVITLIMLFLMKN